MQNLDIVDEVVNHYEWLSKVSAFTLTQYYKVIFRGRSSADDFMNEQRYWLLIRSATNTTICRYDIAIIEVVVVRINVVSVWGRRLRSWRSRLLLLLTINKACTFLLRV